MSDDKTLSADDLIKVGIRDRAEEEGLFAVAYAITKLNDTFGTYISNLAIQHANETYTAKNSSDALRVLAHNTSVIARMAEAYLNKDVLRELAHSKDVGLEPGMNPATVVPPYTSS